MVVGDVTSTRGPEVCPATTDLRATMINLEKAEYVLCGGVDSRHQFGEFRVLV